MHTVQVMTARCAGNGHQARVARQGPSSGW